MSNIILTGDRPTGKLHLGHYVGSLKRRVELQNKGVILKSYKIPEKGQKFDPLEIPFLPIARI